MSQLKGLGLQELASTNSELRVVKGVKAARTSSKSKEKKSHLPSCTGDDSILAKESSHSHGVDGLLSTCAAAAS